MRAVKLSLKHARALLRMASRGWDYDATDRQALAALEIALKPRPVSSQRKRTKARRETRKEETARIREAVFARSGWTCEQCGLGLGNLEMDHFWGRRKTQQSTANCWMLCRFCHHEKTVNHPDAATWLERFERHAAKHGYSAEAAKARARLDALQMIPKTQTQETNR